jgi:lactate dehydrogenase-like 2-hydroxyacid dehydrogenase
VNSAVDRRRRARCPWDEPAIPEGLTKHENVALLPHLGNATKETRTALGMKVVENARPSSTAAIRRTGSHEKAAPAKKRAPA